MTLQERHEQMLDRCVESLKTWKDLITEYVDDDDGASEINKLKETVESYCGISRDFKNSLKALEKTETQINKADESCAGDIIKEMFEKNLKETAITENYTDSDIWQCVFQEMNDVTEVIRKKKKLNDKEFDQLDDSLFCSNVFTPPIDPISKAVIREPVRSRTCKHVYERAMIMDYIKYQKRKAKCPYIGCSSKRLTMSDIVEDSELQNQIRKYVEEHMNDDTDED